MPIAAERKQQLWIAGLAISVLLIIGALYIYILHSQKLGIKPISALNAADNSTQTAAIAHAVESEEKTEGPTKECLHCLCQTVSGCKPVKCANQPPCGVYAISKWYWADVGKLKTTENLNDYTEEDEEFRDYLRCVNNEKCATATVRNYLQIYSRDCNGDGKIDCEDYIALHLYGPTGCRTEPLQTLRRLRLQKCKLD